MARAKRQTIDHRVGVKELKDQASALLDRVQSTGKPILITRNNREIAKLVPVRDQRDPLERVRDLGLLASEPRLDWNGLDLSGLNLDSRPLIDAILSDREGSE